MAASELRSGTRVPARERLVRAALELLTEQDAASVSTRAITDRAEVTAPTLYHHFGGKDALLEAAAAEHFAAYAERHSSSASCPPRLALEQAWDAVVAYGRRHPQLFELLFGATRTRRAGVEIAERLSEQPMSALARLGGLAVSPEAAQRSFLAANIGAALMLIADPEEGEELAVSRASRDGILRSLLTETGWTAEDGQKSLVSAAIALNATLQSANPQQLSEPEFALFLQWLDRLAAPAVPGAADSAGAPAPGAVSAGRQADISNPDPAQSAGTKDDHGSNH